MSNKSFYYPIIDLKATGRNIKYLRKVNGFKVDEIRDYLGLESSRSVFKWQNGETLPSIDNLYALSRLFDVALEDIIVEVQAA